MDPFPWVFVSVRRTGSDVTFRCERLLSSQACTGSYPYNGALLMAPGKTELYDRTMHKQSNWSRDLKEPRAGKIS